jgi:thymidylate synthase ThyX
MTRSTPDADAWAPDFTPHAWSGRDLRFLEPFATRPDGLVTVLRNLPPEIVGALCSRASRAEGSLLEVLLREYIYPIVDGDDPELAGELESTVEFLRHRGFRNVLNNHRAQAFYAKWLSQYGDDSIAQMTGTHVLVWGVSQVALKFIEDQRVGLEPIEKSTRYVHFGRKVGGRYLYYIPSPDLERLGRGEDYARTLDALFDTYVALLEPLQAWLEANFDESPAILEKKAFDTLRGLLPMATVGQVAIRGNAQAFEYLINRTGRHRLGELRWFSGALRRELEEEIPSLLLRLDDPRSGDYQEYLARRDERVRELLDAAPAGGRSSVEGPSARPPVSLVEWDPHAEARILAGILFASGDLGWTEAFEMARTLAPGEAEAIFERYLGGRPARWYKTGRALENSYLRFEILMDIGSYRDLHRHRMMTQQRQLFSARHGYATPPEIEDAGLADRWHQALGAAGALADSLSAEDPFLAQYAVPLAYRVRFHQWQNFRQLFWETELRTISQGHPAYRAVEQEKYRQVKARFPLLARYIQADLEDYPIARRGTEDRIREKEERIASRLRGRSTT